MKRGANGSKTREETRKTGKGGLEKVWGYQPVVLPFQRICQLTWVQSHSKNNGENRSKRLNTRERRCTESGKIIKPHSCLFKMPEFYLKRCSPHG